VRGWRNADGTPSEKPYYSVREEIESICAGIRTPKPAEGTEPPATPPPPQGAQEPDGKPKANLVPTVKRPKTPREKIP
jgi:hypothetical protein